MFLGSRNTATFNSLELQNILHHKLFTSVKTRLEREVFLQLVVVVFTLCNHKGKQYTSLNKSMVVISYSTKHSTLYNIKATSFIKYNIGYVDLLSTE